MITSLVLGRLGVVLVAVAILLCSDLATSLRPRVLSSIHRYLLDLDRELLFLQATFTPKSILVFQAVSLTVAISTCLAQAWSLALIACLTLFAPRAILQILKSKRIATLEQQLENWLLALANAVRTSTSLGQALVSTAELMKDPIKSEIELVIKEYHLGTPLDDALSACGERVASRTFKLALFTLRIARNTGGNLAETLSTTAQNLREMARLDGVVRTKTAEGKAQALVMSLVPIPLYLMIEWLNPGFFDPMKHTFTGQALVVAAFLLWAGAFGLAQRILRVDI